MENIEIVHIALNILMLLKMNQKRAHENDGRLNHMLQDMDGAVRQIFQILSFLGASTQCSG